MKIQILVDNTDSWILPYAEELKNELLEDGYDCSLIHHPNRVVEGDVLCLLSCEAIFRHLHKNRHNLVIHESHLPKGRGWSPLTWQVLQGKNRIPITLFEATEKVDAGEIYLRDVIELSGYELLEEIKHQQGVKTKALIHKFIQNYGQLESTPQQGKATYYRKRKPSDSELDPEKPLKEQFNKLRVVDNERYPAFFKLNGHKYVLKIYREE